MRNVAVTVEHDAGPPGLLGLYQGIPLTSRTTNYAGVLPDRITIYRVAICRICRTEDEVVDQVRRTVHPAVGHHPSALTTTACTNWAGRVQTAPARAVFRPGGRGADQWLTPGGDR